MHKEETIRLKSGARLVYVTASPLPIACASVWFRGGARLDSEGKEGLAHFLEHIITMRTKKHPDKMARIVALEKKGIEFNATTTYETACYYHFSPVRTLEDSLDLLVQGIAENCINEKDIEEERAAILDEEARNRADASQYLWRVSQSGLWPHSALGSGFFGTEKSIQSITKKDITRFFEKYYRPNNATFVVIGSESKKRKVIDRLNMVSWGGNEKVRFSRERFSETKKLSIESRKDGQTWISIGWRTIPEKNEKEKYVAELVGGLFASGWLSLFINRMRVRENLTYWIENDFTNFSDTGYIRFNYSTEKNTVQKSIAVILDEVEKVKKGGLSQENLDMIRFSFLARLSRKNSDIQSLMWFYGWPVTLGADVMPTDVYFRKIREITREDIQTFVKKYCNEKNISVAIVGDVAKQEEKKLQQTIMTHL